MAQLTFTGKDANTVEITTISSVLLKTFKASTEVLGRNFKYPMTHNVDVIVIVNEFELSDSSYNSSVRLVL